MNRLNFIVNEIHQIHQTSILVTLNSDLPPSKQSQTERKQQRTRQTDCSIYRWLVRWPSGQFLARIGYRVDQILGQHSKVWLCQTRPFQILGLGFHPLSHLKLTPSCDGACGVLIWRYRVRLATCPFNLCLYSFSH